MVAAGYHFVAGHGPSQPLLQPTLLRSNFPSQHTPLYRASSPYARQDATSCRSSYGANFQPGIRYTTSPLTIPTVTYASTQATLQSQPSPTVIEAAADASIYQHRPTPCSQSFPPASMSDAPDVWSP